MDEALLDSDILSEVLKGKNQQVLASARLYLATYQRFAFSAMTMYEIMRGMRANQASRQLAGFQAMTSSSDVFTVSIPVLKRAADLWAEARNNGHPRNDADLIIAATATRSPSRARHWKYAAFLLDLWFASVGLARCNALRVEDALCGLPSQTGISPGASPLREVDAALRSKRPHGKSAAEATAAGRGVTVPALKERSPVERADQFVQPATRSGRFGGQPGSKLRQLLASPLAVDGGQFVNMHRRRQA